MQFKLDRQLHNVNFIVSPARYLSWERYQIGSPHCPRI